MNGTGPGTMGVAASSHFKQIRELEKEAKAHRLEAAQDEEALASRAQEFEAKRTVLAEKVCTLPAHSVSLPLCLSASLSLSVLWSVPVCLSVS